MNSTPGLHGNSQLLKVSFVVFALGVVLNSASNAELLPDLVGPYVVGSDHFFYEDHRNVEAHIWYPVPDEVEGDSLSYTLFGRTYPTPFVGGLENATSVLEGEHPLVVFAHGNGGFALQYALVAEALASHGYIVASPQSIDSGESQVADIESITQLVLDRSQATGDKLFGKVNHDAMAFTGYSGGGGDAYRSILERESSVSNLAMIQIEDASGGSDEVVVPTLTIGGDDFSDVFHYRYANPIHGVNIENVHHWSFGTNGCQFDPDWTTNWLGCDPDLRPATEVQEIMAKYTVAFLDQYLKGSEEFSEVLEPASLSGATTIQSRLETDDRKQEVNMLLIDPAGRRLGVDEDSGEVVRDFGSRRSYQGRGYQHTFAVPGEELIAGEYQIVGSRSPSLLDSGIDLRTTITKRGSTSFGNILVRRDLPIQTTTADAALTPIQFTITPQEAGDCSGNGVFDAADLVCARSIEERDAVLSSIDALPGDLNLDGLVDFTDFLTLAENFGATEATYAEGNTNVLNGVDFADFLELASNFGKSSEAISVPEPTWPCSVGFICLVLMTLRCHALRRNPNSTMLAQPH